ncbi:MAG: class I SAM-dependent methyltransferase [Firmicutes bacterium]|nr:class I SAM-dependent methyltransferase [Bacillota bacterium]
MSLVRDENGLSLSWNGMVLRGDFTEMIPRILPGRLESELIVRASGILKNKGESPLAIDATAGLGEDALLLAAAGFRVMLYERDEIVFALLDDAVKRALALPDDDDYSLLKSAVSRMEIINEDSITAINEMAQRLSANDTSTDANSAPTADSYISRRPDVIFLDPMFPERKKSSLVGKKLQMLQQIEKPCENEEEMLNAAFALCPKRIIIKRPPKGPYLGGIKPTFSFSGKSVRIDCIVL